MKKSLFLILIALLVGFSWMRTQTARVAADNISRFAQRVQRVDEDARGSLKMAALKPSTEGSDTSIESLTSVINQQILTSLDGVLLDDSVQVVVQNLVSGEFRKAFDAIPSNLLQDSTKSRFTAFITAHGAKLTSPGDVVVSDQENRVFKQLAFLFSSDDGKQIPLTVKLKRLGSRWVLSTIGLPEIPGMDWFAGVDTINSADTLAINEKVAEISSEAAVSSTSSESNEPSVQANNEVVVKESQVEAAAPVVAAVVSEQPVTQKKEEPTSSGNVIYFAVKSDALTNESREQIKKFAAALKPKERVTLSGFADPSGKASTNTSLALARVEAVRISLIRNKVPGSHIIVGKSGVASSAESPEQQRRVEMTVRER